jgi:hypothetical protein
MDVSLGQAEYKTALTHSHSKNVVDPSGMTTPKLQLHKYHLKESKMVSAHQRKTPEKPELTT